MKIALVTRDLSLSGGTQRQLLELAQHLLRHGHSVVAYTLLAGDRCFPNLTAGLDIRLLPNESRLYRYSYDARAKRMTPANILNRLRSDTLAEALAVRCADVLDADIDLLNGHDVNDLCWAARKKLGVPFVWQCNDLPACFGVGVDSLAGTTVRASIPDAIRRVLRRRKCEAERKWAFYADAITVNVEKNRARMLSCYGRDARVFRCGVDVGSFTADPQRDRTGSFTPFRILSVAVLYRYRRFEDIVRAVSALLPRFQVTCDLVGYEGYAADYAEELRSLIRRLGLEGVVRMHGAVGESQLAEFYRHADAFVWSNHDQSWGNAVFEAQACGTPVIVSKSTGAAEVLTDHGNALLVPPLSPEAIAGAVEELITDVPLRVRLSDRGRELCGSMPWTSYCEAMTSLFEELVAGGVGRPNVLCGLPQ